MAHGPCYTLSWDWLLQEHAPLKGLIPAFTNDWLDPSTQYAVVYFIKERMPHDSRTLSCSVLIPSSQTVPDSFILYMNTLRACCRCLSFTHHPFRKPSTSPTSGHSSGPGDTGTKQGDVSTSWSCVPWAGPQKEANMYTTVCPKFLRTAKVLSAQTLPSPSSSTSVRPSPMRGFP